MGPGNDKFSFLENGVSTSNSLFNPCNSPFENDCDPQRSTCKGQSVNKWIEKRPKEDGQSTNQQNYQNVHFYECECDVNHVNQRQLIDTHTSMWKRVGSVCVENKYIEGNKIFDAAAAGGIGMACFYFVCIIVLLLICRDTKDRRHGWGLAELSN